VSDVIAAMALLVAVAAIVLAYYSYRGSLRASARPVLTFSRTPTSWWKVHNVGSGPAINIIVANVRTGGGVERATSCYPLAAQDGYDLPWIQGGMLTAVYADLFGDSFTTTCDGSTNTVARGNLRPDLAPTGEQWIEQVLAEGPDGSRLTERDLVGKTAFELDVMRNEPYARGGYIFRRDDLRDHFGKQRWYKPVTTNEGLVYSQMPQRERYEAHFIFDYQMRTRASLAPQLQEASTPKHRWGLFGKLVGPRRGVSGKGGSHG
jgi:YARHG domain